MDQNSIIGQSVPKIDALAIATGKAQYTVDIALPGMLVGKILRSPLPHAKIVRIETETAKSLNGVIEVISATDTLRKRYGYREESADEYALAVDKVRYVGEQVAAVAALDDETAEKALSLIEVEYEELSAVTDPREAMRDGAPVIHAEAANNVSYAPNFRWGDVEEGFAKSEYIREDTFITQAQIHCSMEPHASVASYSGNHLTVWSTTQSPYSLRSELALTLGLPLHRIRVIKPYMGGGFGGKREMFPSDFCAALLSIKSGKPVKIVYSRTEEFTASRQRHPMYITIKTGCLRDGSILSKECTVIADGGAYNSRGLGVLSYAGLALATLYRIPNVHYQGYHVYTNKPVGGAFRGYGSLQVRFGDECQMDMIAEDLGIDPVQLRLKNGVEPGDITASGQRITSCGLKECLTTAARVSGWDRKRQTKHPYYGIGVACNDYVSAFRTIYGYDCSSAAVRLNEDGTVDVLTGASDIGQGSNTTLAQIAAEELGVPFDNVNVVAADTALGVLDLGSYASRVTFVAGNAVKRAASDAKEQLLRYLSRHWSVDAADLVCSNGKISAKNRCDLTVDLKESVRQVLNKEGVFVLGRGYYDVPSTEVNYKTGYGNFSPTYSYGVQIAEVKVDPATGRVNVLNVTAAADCGRAINPMCLEGQAEGSIVCGLGMTLTEQRMTECGKTLNPNFLGYKIPTAMDSPSMKTDFIETIDPEGPFGAKGVSEGFQVPTAPAIANAIYNAIGIRFNELPITPEKILIALKRLGEEKRAS
jgi:4-hydroxybenzoyl-CoA reductase alpha subunit